MFKQSFKTLQISEENQHILMVTLNRPEVRNAINIDMMQDLLALWRGLASTEHEIRCVILTGSGDKAFCAGADLKARKDMDIVTWNQQHGVLQQAMLALIDCPIPVIAAVNGAAFGGGLELLMACDFAYATHTAVFAQSETKLGIMPGAMGTQLLPRSSSLKRAKELTFTAQTFSAKEAYAWGIINKLCEADALLPEVLASANLIASNAPLAIMQTKKALNATCNLDLKSGYALEVTAYKELIPTEDRLEGINAFNEKRKPKFTGK